MVCFDICIVGFRVDQGGVDLGMAQEALDLLDGHAGAKGRGGGGVPEDVRSDMGVDAGAVADPRDFILERFGCQRVRGLAEAYNQGRAIVRPGGEISAEGNQTLRIEIDRAALVAFAVADDGRAGIQIHVGNQQGRDLRHAAGRGVKEIYQAFFADGFAGGPHGLQLHRRHGMALRVLVGDHADAGCGIPLKVSFIRSPGEKAADHGPDVVQG